MTGDLYPLIGAIVFSSCVALIGIPLASRGLHLLQRARMLIDTETSRIDDVTRGHCEVRGRVVSVEAPLVSPFAQRECVYFAFTVMERTTRMKRGKMKTKWRTLFTETGARRCMVDDGTGQAEFLLSHAELDFEVDLYTRSGFLNDAPPHVEALLKDHGKSSVGLMFNKAMRYSETVLAVGDELFVAGDATTNASGQPLFAKALVSDRGEASLIRRYRLRALRWFFGAALMVTAGVALIALQLTRH